MNMKNSTGRDLTKYIPMMNLPSDLPMDPAKVRAMLEPDDKYNAPMPLTTKIVLGVFVLLLIAAIAWPVGIALGGYAPQERNAGSSEWRATR